MTKHLELSMCTYGNCGISPGKGLEKVKAEKKKEEEEEEAESLKPASTLGGNFELLGKFLDWNIHCAEYFSILSQYALFLEKNWYIYVKF